MSKAMQAFEETQDFQPDRQPDIFDTYFGTSDGQVVDSEDSPASWQEPVFFGEIETPEIPANSLPTWLGSFVGAVSDSTQTPPGMAVMIALSVVAACLQKRYVVAPYGDDYTEPVCLWTLTALPPASRKTAAFNALTQPLTLWEKEEGQRLKPDIELWKTNEAVMAQRITDLQRKAAKEEDKTARNEIISEIEKLKENLSGELREPRLWTGDVTPERLQGLMVEHGERMSVISDEGGIFEVMSGLYNDGHANIDVFLKSHAGSAVRVDRGSRTVHLHNPALTFGLTVQPEIIRDLSQGSKKRFRGNGALARFLYCLPKSNIGSRDVAKRAQMAASIKAGYEAGILRLLSIPVLVDDYGVEQPRTLKLSDTALHCWQQFAQFIEVNQGEGKELDSIQDWSGKLPGAALRIAGLLHVAEHEGSSLTIDQQTMERALDISGLLIPHAKAAFELMSYDQAMTDAKWILSWILKQRDKSFKQNTLHRTGRFNKSKLERLTKALDLLAERNIISAQHKLSTRKPTYVYYVNPAAFAETTV